MVADTVCVLLYKGHAVCATRISSEAPERELAHRARQAEDEPVDLLTEMVNQLRLEIDQNPNRQTCLVVADGSSRQRLQPTIRAMCHHMTRRQGNVQSGKPTEKDVDAYKRADKPQAACWPRPPDQNCEKEGDDTIEQKPARPMQGAEPE